MIDLRELAPASLPLDMLRRYLKATGWHVAEAGRRDPTPLGTIAARVLLDGRTAGTRNFTIYVSALADFQGVELVVPSTVDSPEYAQLIARVFEGLAALEDREEEEVLRAVREVGFDVLRSRIPDAQVVGDAIHLNIARGFIVGIRNVLASTAHTELAPSPYFLRLRREGADYADRCRFAHTFRGRLGFTVESPLEPNAQATLPGIVPAPPFERRVVQRLSRGLHHVSQAVAQDSTAPITSGTKTGFSANICEHLAALVEDTSRGGISFDFSFSPEWGSGEEPTPPAEQYVLGPGETDVIKAAARELRAQIQSWDETVFGRVIRLASDADPSDLTDMLGEREVVILWSSEVLGDITVRLPWRPATTFGRSMPMQRDVRSK